MASTEMAVPVNERVVVGARRQRYIHWRSAVGGAVAAAALGLVLQGFAAAIGLSLASTSPTWRDTSTMLILLAGLYLIFSAIIAFGLGGYIAGRASSAFSVPTVDREEIEFRDGSNGLLAWALAMLLTTFIAFGAAQSAAARLGTASAPQSSAAESLIAFDIDKLFRGDKPLAGDMAYARAEAGRILLTANGHRGLSPMIMTTSCASSSAMPASLPPTPRAASTMWSQVRVTTWLAPAGPRSSSPSWRPPPP